MAWYSEDSYQALAAALVANRSTTVTCPADPSSNAESRSATRISASCACRTGPTAARYFLYWTRDRVVRNEVPSHDASGPDSLGRADTN